MPQSDLKRRTRVFGLRVIRLVEELPRGRSVDVIARQLVRSGTSVGSNYRAACRARSKKEFIAKMGIVEEEADESGYWIEMLMDASFCSQDAVAPLIDEADQLTAIAVSSINTARGGPRRS